MGKINLTALRVRRRALADIQAQRATAAPIWLDVLADVPPAQTLTRKQPQQHAIPQIRTKSLPDGTTKQVVIEAPKRKRTKSTKPSRLFGPVEIKYEEDELRRQFFQDHPWELARPRLVVETDGNQHKKSDYSTGLLQQGIPLSGESVVQRQLHLLQTVPDMTVDQAYDVARREFYTLRRQEATRVRVAKEEALHMGAKPEKSILVKGMSIENKHYMDWERWSKEQIMEQLAKSAAFSGETAPVAEQPSSEGEKSIPGISGRPAARNNNVLSPFEVQKQYNDTINRGPL